jgi:hypothetical protein
MHGGIQDIFDDGGGGIRVSNLPIHCRSTTRNFKPPHTANLTLHKGRRRAAQGLSLQAARG